MKKIIKLFLTLFNIGYLPLMPGTWASIAACGFYYLCRDFTFYYFSFSIILVVGGFFLCNHADLFFSEKDPKPVVIDEFSAQLLCFVFIPFSISNLIIGFALFRVLDILKFPPVVKRAENLPKGAGIMMDDVLCAVTVNIVLHIKFFLERLVA